MPTGQTKFKHSSGTTRHVEQKFRKKFIHGSREIGGSRREILETNFVKVFILREVHRVTFESSQSSQSAKN